MLLSPSPKKAQEENCTVVWWLYHYSQCYGHVGTLKAQLSSSLFEVSALCWFSTAPPCVSAGGERLEEPGGAAALQTSQNVETGRCDPFFCLFHSLRTPELSRLSGNFAEKQNPR